MPFALTPKGDSEIDHRKAVLSLRWLLVILASYLTLFSFIGTEQFPLVFGAALAFSFSNIVLMLLPKSRFSEQRTRSAVAALDVICVCTTFYLLRVPENYFYIGFIGIFLLAALWRDLRLILLSLLVVSILYGTFSYFRFVRFQADVNIERFLTLALFFIVSIFYIFLADRLTQDAKMANALREEARMAEVIVEMTRTLSSSLNTDEVLYSIVTRLCEVLQAEDCMIVKIDPKTARPKVMVIASDPKQRNIDIDLDDHPELKQAHASRSLLYSPEADPAGVIVIPMITQDSVLGLIEVRSRHLSPELTGTMARFFEVMAGTAANALRNAQLFEEVEHRARTDYLTGLPNHRYFQATLSVELGRAQRHNHPLSLLIIDLDFLKQVNDRFGHPSGDMVIRSIAETIRSTCREIDFAARYGGEEFTVILSETPLSGAIQVADRIRERIAEREFPGIGSVTASIGISNYPVNALSREDLIRIADQALYVAKNEGRNRISYFNYQMITR
jgi:diguanylate cyclase (GGDEF)-like protein